MDRLSSFKFSETNFVVPVFGTCLRRVLGELLFLVGLSSPRERQTNLFALLLVLAYGFGKKCIFSPGHYRYRPVAGGLKVEVQKNILVLIAGGNLT